MTSYKKYDFLCLGYEATSSGEVKYYILSARCVEDDTSEVFSLTPKEISSHISMKRILLDRKIVYIPTKKEHDEMLNAIFQLNT